MSVQLNGGLAYLRVEQVRVYDSSFDVVQVGVVFQSPLQKPRLLAQLGDVGTIVVGEHLVSKDGISNLQEANLKWLELYACQSVQRLSKM